VVADREDLEAFNGAARASSAASTNACVARSVSSTSPARISASGCASLAKA